MDSKAQDSPGKSEETYRISGLVAASGVSRDMIKYYLRAGLLPPAEKPRPNLALYTPNHLALIGLIRKFQENTKLSLQEISELFSAAKYDTNAIELQLLSARRRVSDDGNIIPLRTRPESNRSLDFPAGFLHQLENASLLGQAGRAGQNEDQLAGLLWAAHNAGVPLAFFETAREKLAELADLEVKTLIAIRRPGLSFSDTVESVTDADRIINRWLIAEKNRQIRSRFQRVMDNSERALSTLLDTIYRPSALFRERHRIDDMLWALPAQPDAGKASLQQSRDLCFACLLLGEYDRAITIAEAILAAVPGDAVATALTALAHGMQNSVDEAFEFGSRLERGEIHHPAILQARMLSLLLKAAKLGGIADTAELMKSAGELFLELPDEPATDQHEATLLLARANVAFPDFANSRPRAIGALQALVQQIGNDTLELPELPVPGLSDSLQAVYRIYALYYLGMLHDMNGDHTAAGPCFEQVIQLDPASNFGARAYLHLGRPDGSPDDE